MTGNANGRPRLDANHAAPVSYSGDDVKAAVNAALTESRMDGWFNTITSLGTSLDKSTGSEMCVEPVNEEEARWIYRGDSFGARIADARPREMFRPGWKLKISDADVAKKKELERSSATDKPLTRADARRLKRRLDALASKTKDLSERVMNRARDLEVNYKFKRALTLANVDGGSAILIGANDGAKDWKLPLNTKALVRPDQLKWLTVLEMRHLEPVAWYNNPQAEKYGQVAIWRINPVVAGGGQGIDSKFVPKSIEVHETRLIIFQGIKLTDGQLSGVRTGFGDSIYTRLKSTLSRYALGWNSAAILLNEFSLATMKIKGLAEMVSQDAQKKLMVRMAAVQLGRSIARVTLLDKEEELTRDTAALTGVAELLFALMQEMAGQADIPVTILMGMSPAGMNATGESDTRGWYDRIAGEWSEKIDPQLRRLMSIFLRTENGGNEPEKWSIDPNSWWQESPKEKAETRGIDAATDEKNIGNGIYSAEEARRSRYGGDEYGDEIVIDTEDDDAAPLEIDPDLEEAKKMKTEGALDPKAPAPGTSDKPVTPGANVQPTGQPAAGGDIQKAALNGAQIASMVEVVKAAVNGEIPREAAQAILEISIQLSAADAARVLGPTNFKPKEEPAPMPFGGGGFGGPPKPPAAPPIPSGKEDITKGDKPELPIPSGKKK
jgi:phage-related protein (TIGR01555 family)